MVSATAGRARGGSTSAAAFQCSQSCGSPRPRAPMNRRACTGPIPSCSRSSRNQARSSAGLVTTRAAAMKSLTCAASVNRMPPYLMNGMRRTDSSISSTSLCVAARISTAWSRRSAPASRASSTRPQISRAWVASSWQRTSWGRDAGPAFRPQGQLQALGLRPDRVGQPQHRVLGAVVAGQPDDLQARVVRGQRAQVRRVGAAEGVDGLRVVAHAGQALAVGAQQPDDVGLDRVDVLVLVHQDGVEHAAQHRARGRVGQRGPPQQQQVVEVDQAVLAFVRGVGPEQARPARSRSRPPTGTGP